MIDVDAGKVVAYEIQGGVDTALLVQAEQVITVGKQALITTAEACAHLSE
jgi:uncharacterized protein YrrD